MKCPFCNSEHDCEHLLLVVDKTFRTAEGGALMRAFNTRWSELCEAGGDDFDEREPFDELTEEVDSLADFSDEYDVEGGPGMSSEYAIYYAKTEDKVKKALASFTSGGS